MVSSAFPRNYAGLAAAFATVVAFVAAIASRDQLLQFFNSSHQSTICHDEDRSANALDPDRKRERLLDELRGKTIRIHDLHSLFDGWCSATNPKVKRLQEAVDSRLEGFFRPGKRLARLKAADPGLFGAMWWPYADYDRLFTATNLSIWLFAWDDETDSIEFSSLASDFGAGQKFRAETLKYCRQCLGFVAEAEKIPPPQNPMIQNFADIGETIYRNSTLGQRQCLMRMIEWFIDMSEVEQRIQLSKELPSVEEYRKRRMGTSAVAVCLAIQEYALGIVLPQIVTQDPDMGRLWDETNVIISTVNDILSVKKEVAQDQVDSLIPLLYAHQGRDVQAAIDTATRILAISVESFEQAAQALLARHSSDATLKSDLVKFIDACRYACTANLNWSLVSGRYYLGRHSLRGGIEISI